GRMDELERQVEELKGVRSAKDDRANLEKELLALMTITLEESFSLRKRVECMKKRFGEYEDAKRALSGGNLRQVASSAEKDRRQDSGREPTIEETATAAGISVEETRRVLKISRHPISLDRPVGESEDSYFGDFIEDDSVESPVNAATQEMLKDKIESVLKTLTYREREIIKLRYGLGDGYTYTLEEVGRIFKVTRERVRQIEAKAVRKLQHPVRSRQLEGFRDST